MICLLMPAPTLAWSRAPARPLDADVIIAGGGLGGLALCSGLRSRGLRTLVLERAPELRTASQGTIILWPNGISALRELGSLEERVRPRGVAVQRTEIVLRDASGAETRRPGFAGGVDATFVPWARVQSELAAAAADAGDASDDWLRCGHTVVGYREHDECVEVRLEGGGSLCARVLVGADGTFSRVRRAMFPRRAALGLDSVRTYGQSNWNSVVTAEEVAAAFGGGEAAGGEAAGGEAGGGEAAGGEAGGGEAAGGEAGGGEAGGGEAGGGEAGGGATEGGAAVGGEAVGGAAELVGGVVGAGEAKVVTSASPPFDGYLVDVGEGQLFWQLRASGADAAALSAQASARGGLGLPGVRCGGADRTRERTRMRWCCSAHRLHTTAALLTSTPPPLIASTPLLLCSRPTIRASPHLPCASSERLLQFFDDAAAAGLASADLRAAIACAPSHNVFQRAILDRKPLSRWSSRKRRVTLLGDAAHAMHPRPGQGANQAFEDAAVLARVLADAAAAESEAASSCTAPLACARIVRGAIAQYEAERTPRANAVHAYAHRLGVAQRDRRPPAPPTPEALAFLAWLQQFPPEPGSQPPPVP
jgi:2-polyprenyl-6-methoxyphenol hydroxylase-like FAD-dependent oxidoreductase